MSNGVQLAIRDVIVALITAVATLSGSYYMFKGEETAANVELYKALYEQVQDLQVQIKQRDQEIFELREQMTSLRIQLSKKYEASDVLRGYLDAMPYPAWIKVVDRVGEKVHFVMWHINGSYESHFNISSARYVGRTDFDIWPQDIAQGFYTNDLTTLTMMSDYCTREDIGDGQRGYVCKWVLTVEGQIAIAGQLIPDNREIEHD